MKPLSKIAKKLTINFLILFIFGIIASYVGPDRHIFIKIFIGFTLAAIILGDYMISTFNEFFIWIDNKLGIKNQKHD